MKSLQDINCGIPRVGRGHWPIHLRPLTLMLSKLGEVFGEAKTEKRKLCKVYVVAMKFDKVEWVGALL